MPTRQILDDQRLRGDAGQGPREPRVAGVVVPVYDGHDVLARCLVSVAVHTDASVALVLVDDASPDPRILPLLRAFAERRAGVTVVARERNGGFARAVNDGVAHLPPQADIVVLNADTEVTAGWLAALARAIRATPNAGIACPLSNHATILSTPRFNLPQALPEDADAGSIAAWLAEQGPLVPAPWLPTAVGFCMYVTRGAWDAAGPLDEAFGRGYGEECDLSLRAWARGLRIVCAADAFVAHVGSASFGTSAAVAARRRVAEALMDARWPTYRRAVATFLVCNPLRDRLEAMRRWLGERRVGTRVRVVHLVHRWGRTGGVENVVHSLASLAPDAIEHVVLVPWPGALTDWHEIDGAEGLRVVGLRVPTAGHPSQAMALEDDVRTLAALRRALRTLAPDVVHVHHFLGWNTLWLTELAREAGAGVLLSLHDYLLLCPNYNFARVHGLPCEKSRFDPADRECHECLGAFLRAPATGIVDVLRLQRYASAAERTIAAADRIVAPSMHTCDRYRRALPSAIAARIEVVGFEGLAGSFVAPRPVDVDPQAGTRALTVTFLGAFSFAKGADLFIAAARRLAGTGMRFRVVGPVDPAYAPALQALGIVASGAYRREDLPDLLAGTDIVCLLSRWEETWGFTLDEALASRRVVVAARSGAWTARAEDQPGVVLVPPSDHHALIAALTAITVQDVQAAGARSSAVDPRAPLRWVELYRSVGHRGRPLTVIGSGVEAEIHEANERLRTSLPAAGARVDVAIGDPAYADWIAAHAAWRAPPEAERAGSPGSLHVVIVGSADDAALTEASLRTHGEAIRADLLPCDAAAVNRAIVASSAEWVALVQAGDRVAPGVVAMSQHHGAAEGRARVALYFDDDLATLRGARYAPRFKPGYDDAYFAACPDLLEGLCLVRRDALLAAGGFPGATPAANLEVVRRLCALHGAGAIERIPRIGAHRLDVSVVRRRFDAVTASPSTLGAADPLAASAERAPPRPRSDPVTIRCAIRLDAAGTSLPAMVSAVVAQRGVVIVAVEPYAVGSAAGAPMLRQQDPRVVALRHYESVAVALNDIAARTREDLLLVADESVVPLAADALASLASVCTGDIVAATPRLVAADGTLRSAGAVLGAGPDGVVGDLGYGVPAQSAGYLSELVTPRRVGAVPAAFALIHRRALAGAAPFDGGVGDDYVMADMCLAASRRGQHAVFEPAVAVRDARRAPSPIRDTARPTACENATAAMQAKWGAALVNDPFHNPNRPLGNVPHLPFDAALVVPWLGYPKSRTRVVAAPFDTWGSGQYRVRLPIAALASRGLVEATLLPGHERGFMPTWAELARAGVDTLFAHHPFHDYQLAALAAYRRAGGVRIVVGIDDRLDALPSYNPYSHTIYPDIAQRIRRAVDLADAVVVSTPALAEAYGDGKAVVIRNAVDPQAWPASKPHRRRTLPRIGWAGAAQHEGDLALLVPVVAATCAAAEWVFLGLAPPGVPAASCEVHPMVPFDRYPQALAALDLDLAVAPLAANAFNEAKSDLKLLEYGMLGIPAVCSNRRAYRHVPCARVDDSTDAWIAALHERIADAALRRREGMLLAAWAREEGPIEKQVPLWLEALRGGRRVG